MYVIAQYAEGAEHPPCMELFKKNQCGIDFSPEGYICSTVLKYEDFTQWYAEHGFTDLKWDVVDTLMLSTSIIVVAGKRYTINENIMFYTAEEDSVISESAAKSCGLWPQILDKIYASVERR